MAPPIFKKISARTGMSYDPDSKSLYGTYQGFSTVLRVSANNQYVLTFWVKELSTPMQTPDEFFSGLKQNHKELSAYSFQDNRLTLLMRGKFGANGTVELILSILDEAVGYLRGYYTDCCVSCGATENLDIYVVEETPCLFCESCSNQAQLAFTEQSHKSKAKGGNIVAGIVGALLGSLIGVALWVLIYQLGYIAAISGLVLSICTLKGYEKFSGGRMGVAGLIICCVLMLGMVFFSQRLAFGVEIYREFASDYGITFFDAWNSIPAFLEEPQISSAYYGDMALGYVFTIAGGASVIYTQVRAMTHRFKMKKLERTERTDVGVGV